MFITKHPQPPGTPEKGPEKSGRRPRRNREAIKEALYSAITEIINEKGFPKLNIQNVAATSNVSMDVIYKHYQSFSNLLEQYFEQYDFWATLSPNITKQFTTDRAFFKDILKELYTIMAHNREFQCIIRWEVAAPNNFIIAKAKWREMICQEMLNKNQKYFTQYGIDANALYALLISGIYYLVLRKDISTFCGIDFTSADGHTRLNNTIDLIGNLLSEHIDKEGAYTHHLGRIARNLSARNMPDEEIAGIMETDRDTVREWIKAS